MLPSPNSSNPSTPIIEAPQAKKSTMSTLRTLPLLRSSRSSSPAQNPLSTAPPSQSSTPGSLHPALQNGVDLVPHQTVSHPGTLRSASVHPAMTNTHASGGMLNSSGLNPNKLGITVNGASRNGSISGTTDGTEVKRTASQPSRSRSLSRPLVGTLSALALGSGIGNNHNPSGGQREQSASGHGKTAAGGGVSPPKTALGKYNSAPLPLIPGLGPGIERAPTPLAPSPSLGAIPMTSTPSTTNSIASTGGASDVQHGGYIDAIGLRLNEQVNRACLGVDWKARKGFKTSMGWNLGTGVIKELPSPQADAYLLRAVLRTSVRSLTIFVSRLEYFLLPAVTDSAFGHALTLTPSLTSLPHSAGLNQTQMFALSVCHAAWETCEVLEVALETSQYPRFVAELLRPVMDKLDSVVGRVVTPLMALLKKELVSSLEITGLQSPPPTNGKGLPGLNGSNGNTGNGNGLGLAATTALPSTLPAKAVNHIPACLRSFAAKVDGARKIFELVCKDCQDDGESWTTSVVVAVIWKGLCLSTSRSVMGSSASASMINGRPPSPEAMAKALATLAKEGTGPAVLDGKSPAPAGAVSKMAASILPSRAISRPASPPRKSIEIPGSIVGGNGHVGHHSHATVLPLSAVVSASFEALITRLVNGLVQKPAVVPLDPSDPNAVTENLTREALLEAQEAITSMKLVMTGLEMGPKFMCDVCISLRDDREMPTEKEEEISDAAEDIPAIFLFGFLASRFNKALSAGTESYLSEPYIRSPAQVWAISEDEYDRQFLSGFGVAEERARRVAFAYKGEVERVVGIHKAQWDGLAVEGGGHEAAKEWLRALSIALDARSGVKVAVQALK